MRIAVDCRSVFPGAGGIGHHTASLVRALAEVDGHHEYSLLFTHRKDDAPLVRHNSFHELKFQTGMIDECWEQIQLPTVLADRDVDLYHSPCFALPVVQTTPYRVATVHDVVFRTHPELVDPPLCSYLDRWTEHSLDVADAVITVSEFSKREITATYGTPTDKVHVIHNGIDRRFRRKPTLQQRAALRAKLALPEHFVLYVGSLEPKKNTDRLLEAFGLLVQDNRDGLKLVLAGGRGSKPYDVGAAVERAGVDEHVLVTGYVADDEVVTLMHLADLFVYPSLYEGFGLPPLEAMVCGTPTVVSDATCLPEVVGDGALVAPAEDITGLAEKIRRALEDKKLRKRLAWAGRRRAKEFTWDRAARQTLAVYESVAGGGQ